MKVKQIESLYIYIFMNLHCIYMYSYDKFFTSIMLTTTIVLMETFFLGTITSVSSLLNPCTLYL